VVQGKLYRREQDGRIVYSTRELPGSVEVLAFTVKTPEPNLRTLGLGKVGPPRLDRYPKQFVAGRKATGVDDALLRAIAHAGEFLRCHGSVAQGRARGDAAAAGDRARVRGQGSVQRQPVDQRRARAI
jgi:hypothetical protein